MQKLGITQKELSEKTGISEPTLSRVFKFSRVPDLNEVEQICSTLNLRLSSAG
ncbi:helix-turn-helix domain-containing protein [Arcanobacterium hippocoleae]|uniref:helix-turn-helix domain-containing protein n=1 Tax=Arcanobacterium hippocoleae TaxID=149017 RepID=UPI003341921A